jgi:hypothetical protein
LGLVEIKVLRKEAVGMTQKKMAFQLQEDIKNKEKNQKLLYNGTQTKCTTLLYIIYN